MIRHSSSSPADVIFSSENERKIMTDLHDISTFLFCIDLAAAGLLLIAFRLRGVL